MALELLAPAKVNLALEVLGRRPDGFHDVASVVQTIDLADRVILDDAPRVELELAGEELLGVPVEGPRNLAYRAAVALASATGYEGGARIRLERAVPAGLGLGGGSSDAAAVLRGLNRLWRLRLADDALARVAAKVGSDVPFFLQGGTALVSGRGEGVELLPDAPALEITVFVAKVEIEDKTRRMYACLTPADYSDGRRARVLAESLRRGLPIAETDLLNAFDRHVGEVLPAAAGAMAVCREAGFAVHACGSGPGFFTLTPLQELPPLLLREVGREWGFRGLACRFLGREAATAVRAF